MCGIVGYLGRDNATPVLINGLKHLEYRGYDSAGIAVFNGDHIEVVKAKGRLANLEERLEGREVAGHLGIGHTRWATHGEPSDINSHPHTDVKGEIAIVHNGIIENYAELKAWLMDKGCQFVSETDTEVVAHMLNQYYTGDMKDTLFKVLPKLRGSFALGIIVKSQPDTLYCARKDSPLVVGAGEDGTKYIASDIPAILEYTRDIYLMDNGEIGVLKTDGVTFYDEFGTVVSKEIMHVDWDIKSAEKGGYAHFMIKEIHEQPAALRDTMSPHVDPENYTIRQQEMPLTREQVEDIAGITILACGTAYHAGMVGKWLFEAMARIPVEVDIASEFRYRDPIIRPGTLCIIISQSGETADTIAAMREAKRQGARILAITNVVGSTIAREADQVIYTWAGPEIAVASTKAYVSQVMVLTILAADIAHKRGRMSDEELRDYVKELLTIPDKAAKVLEMNSEIQRFAHKHFDKRSVFYLGRGLDYALALEASLKLKEISYIHSEAYAAGELKHGTIALIEPGTLVVSLVTQSKVIEKTISNIIEVKVRGAETLAVAFEGDTKAREEVKYLFTVPKTSDLFAPMLAIIPMQMLAYYMALEKGCDIDKPRNLAKSVTVE
ncbi:glutamine--fructose-6-phosphate transaminase (isomerizing) [Gehongia tenuis]|uniref:Glutamine--fructose-6-phosphate aminotransferase [isomerizing] n=1 Tax=Gehongia tenuis TaxID=2763655 RepID=A0A926HPJ5_9FIRM|nr:glutamine--fructose-6-phosphate transaminase (isomerizing) [Gehongia tenuis]MBC8531288.1 glutamine--fructose-6-phosphate transaminase (isomerizing) [Gehongia tenuis]